MKEQLQEALGIVNEICADASEEYPVGLLGVRRLLQEVLADWWDEDDVAVLAEPPAKTA